MKNEDQAKKLYQAVTDMDDKLIEEAQNEETFTVQRITEKPKRHWANIAIAACTVLVIGGGLTLLHGRSDVEEPPQSVSSNVTETGSNTQGTTTTAETTTTTTTTTTAPPLAEEEQELHGLCESLTRKFYDLVTKEAYQSAPLEDCINMCDYVDSEKFAAWLHYRAFNSEITNGDIVGFTYTPVEVRSDSDFRFVTAELQLTVDEEQYDMGTQQFVLFKKDGAFTILDWYEEREGSPDQKWRGINGEYVDENFKAYWATSSDYPNEEIIDNMLGNNSDFAYDLPEIGADVTDVVFGGGGQYGYDCNTDEIQLLRDALANLNCSLTQAYDGYWQTLWKINTDNWSLCITTDYGLIITFEEDIIDEPVYLCDYSGAVQELVRTMLEMAQYHRMTHTINNLLLLHDPDDLMQLIAIPDRQQAWSLVAGMRLLPCEGSFNDLVEPITIGLSYADLDGNVDVASAEHYYIDSTGKVYFKFAENTGLDDSFMYQDQTDSAAQLYAMLKPLLPD